MTCFTSTGEKVSRMKMFAPPKKLFLIFEKSFSKERCWKKGGRLIFGPIQQFAENKVPDNQQKERQEDKDEEKQLATGFCPL